MTRSAWAQCRSCGEDLRGAPLRCPICGAKDPVVGPGHGTGPQTIARALFSSPQQQPGSAGASSAEPEPATRFEPAAPLANQSPDPAPDPRPDEVPRRFTAGPFGPAFSRRRQKEPERQERAAGPATGELGGVSRDAPAVTVVQPGPDPSLRASRDPDEVKPAQEPAQAHPEPPAARMPTVVRPDADATPEPEADDRAPASEADTAAEPADADLYEDYEAYEEDVDDAPTPTPRKIRGGALVVASRRGRELAPAAEKQSDGIVRRITRITAMTLILIGMIGAASWWMENNNLGLDLGLDPSSTQGPGDTPAPTEAAVTTEAPAAAGIERVAAEPDQSWFLLLPGDEGFDHAIVRSNAPVRLRLEGDDPILLPANRSLRVSGAALPLEARAIRTGTEIEVTRSDDAR